MIVRLRGILLERQPDGVVVDAGGVGYLVRVTLRTLAHLPATGQRVDLRTHHHVTETSRDLFGFGDAEEQHAFELLLKVKGVGPRSAIQILSAIPAGELGSLIAAGDKARLTALPGIGAKTADRLIVELKDLFAEAAPAVEDDGVDAQAVAALVGLGLKPIQATDAVRKAKGAGTETLEDIVREALRQGVRT